MREANSAARSRGNPLETNNPSSVDSKSIHLIWQATIGWKARRDVAAMCVDARRWQAANPNRYV